VAAIALLALAVLPVLDADWWVVRSLDFPRVQLLALTILVAVGLALFERRSLYLWLALIGAAFAFHLDRVLPFTPLFFEGVKDAETCQPDRQIDIVLANVLQDNRDFEATLTELRNADADLILAMETDERWQAALSPLRASHPHGPAVPLDNSYGMILYSRLPLSDVSVRYTVEPDVPSIAATLETEGGKPVRFIGIHPRPPLPGKDTGTRDAEIVMSAIDFNNNAVPVILAGDMNDVPWSGTSDLFRQVSGARDPRFGRGIYPTFFTGVPGLSWPLDSAYLSDNFKVLALDTLPRHGSDHAPLFLSLCLTDADPVFEEEDLVDPTASTEAREEIEAGLEQQQEEMAAGEDETMTPAE
jgi:endonuclease/exonuclease/phosphatase (EEP) superfamily protein YafD